MKIKSIILSIALVISVLSIKAQDDFITYFEQTDFLETTNYEQTLEFCRRISAESPWVTYQTIGKSAQNYDIPLLIVDSDMQFTPKKARNSGKLVLLVQAGIHPGEPDGNDAMQMLLRDILIRKEKTELLNNVTILFIPVLNADGLNRFGPYNRINQNGPVKMGWRTNGQNLNLNRDFMKAETPAVQSWLNLYNQWEPEFFIDCHTTDGADYQYTITYMLETLGNMNPGLTSWQKDGLIPHLDKQMEDSGYLIFPYVSFRNWHDPRSGLYSSPSPPMLSQGYTALRNRPGLLIETHMLKSYKERVFGTKRMIELVLGYLKEEGRKLQHLISEADKHTTSQEFRNTDYPLAFTTTTDSIIQEFKGIDYEVLESDLTGGNWYKYGNEPKTFHIPYFFEQDIAASAIPPEGYIFDPAYTSIADLLKRHGVKVYQLEEAITLPVHSYFFTNVSFSNRPYEGHQRVVDFNQKKIHREVRYPGGSWFVPTNQKLAKVILHLLEPAAVNSLLSWGYFNAIFEQKEYAETYVMEKKARQMISTNPEIKKAFDEALREGRIPSNNQWMMLNWFYQRTPYWDQQKNIYPVGRIEDKTAFNKLQVISKVDL